MIDHGGGCLLYKHVWLLHFAIHTLPFLRPLIVYFYLRAMKELGKLHFPKKDIDSYKVPYALITI